MRRALAPTFKETCHSVHSGSRIIAKSKAHSTTDVALLRQSHWPACRAVVRRRGSWLRPALGGKLRGICLIDPAAGGGSNLLPTLRDHSHHRIIASSQIRPATTPPPGQEPVSIASWTAAPSVTYRLYGTQSERLLFLMSDCRIRYSLECLGPPATSATRASNPWLPAVIV